MAHFLMAADAFASCVSFFQVAICIRSFIIIRIVYNFANSVLLHCNYRTGALVIITEVATHSLGP